MEQVIAQVRLPKKLMEEMDLLIEKGLYMNRSDVIRDALRKLALEKMVGILPSQGDSVAEIRDLRKKLSQDIKSYKDLKKINKLVK